MRCNRKSVPMPETFTEKVGNGLCSYQSNFFFLDNEDRKAFLQNFSLALQVQRKALWT